MAAMTLGETVRVLERGGQDLVQGAGNRDDRGGGGPKGGTSPTSVPEGGTSGD